MKMKVLYAIQGTGNGHLSRARDIVPILQKHNLDLDLLISGTQADIQIPFPIKYRLRGWSFIFGKQGGVDVWKTYLRTNSALFQKEIKSVPVSTYDLIINDFEPVSAWACKLKDKPCVSLSHQAAVLSATTPKPKKNDTLGRLILKNYAPTTKQFGLHFQAYEKDIYTPIIRQEIRNMTRTEGNHYAVYLPSYSDENILKILSKIENVQWEVFSKHAQTSFFWKNISIRKINNDAFIESMAASKGVLCGAGFETPAEALHLGKKLMVIPMKGQYEQQCNAAALNDMGVPVIPSLKMKHLDKIKDWVEGNSHIEVCYPDMTEGIIDRLLQETRIGEYR